MPFPLLAIAAVAAAQAAARYLAAAAIRRAIIVAAERAALEAAKRAAAQAVGQGAKKIVEKAAQQAATRSVAQTARRMAVPKRGNPTRGNTRPSRHRGKQKKKKTDCKKVLRKYPVHAYKDKATNGCSAGSAKQSHHVIQNAHFMVGGKTVSAVCKNYTKDAAPCIPLTGTAADSATEHGKATRGQEIATREYKKNLADNGKNPTYKEARANAKKQLNSIGLKNEEAECILKEVDKSFKKLCPGLNELRIAGK
jgi:hypothetical protein